mgnify:CR=1 FL=1
MSEQTQTAVAKQEILQSAPQTPMEVAVYRMPDMVKMAEYAFASKMYPVQSVAQAFSLIMTGQAFGIHPWLALRMFHYFLGKHSMTAEAMQALFQSKGGTIRYIERTDAACEMEFMHPQCGTFAVRWTIEMAQGIKQYQKEDGESKGAFKILAEKDNWKNYPRRMLNVRCISEGVRSALPGVVIGIYTPEEIEDMTPDERDRITGPAIDMPAGGFQDVSAPFKPGLPAQGVKVPDAASGTAPAANQTTPEPPKRMSLEQRKKIFAMLKGDKSAFQAVITSLFPDAAIKSTRDLTAEQAGAIIEYLEGQKTEKKEGKLVEELNLDEDPFTGEKDVIE